MYLYAALDDVRELLLADQECNFQVELLIGICSVNVAKVLRDVLVEYETSYCCIDYLGYLLVSDVLCYLYLDVGMDETSCSLYAIRASLTSRNTLPSPGSPGLSIVR